MNETLKNLVKLRVAGMLSEAARMEAEKRFLCQLERRNYTDAVTDSEGRSNDLLPNL